MALPGENLPVYFTETAQCQPPPAALRQPVGLEGAVSGHLRSCSFSHGNKVFPVCAKCGVACASPEHILSCLRLSRETFETDPLLALDFSRVSGLMDG
ncbi:hypothetical protein AVEN_212172-1 [Araneus ventricosus]|uniref:Uncharacterized protein n=1 Tax=Araneus ventricosus TaxID=182803 RepID=A0A4Y2Q9A6_ARAVE|nr:hypothetical protein AVEN_212172-1 [Araneus ventricosus]